MPTKRRRARQRTLAVDVGGSGVKCALLDAQIVHRDVVYSLPASKSGAFKRFELGARRSDRLRVRAGITNSERVERLRHYDRLSVGGGYRS